MKIGRIAVASSALVVATLVCGASAQTLYRYVDANGRVVYSDQPPPADAKNVEPRRLNENVIETDKVPLQAKQAAENFPVTLYTFDCNICREAQGLLVKRGIPFQTVIVSEEKGLAKLKALTGKQSAPVLAIGDKQVLQGYNEDSWQAALDDAGYPRTLPPGAKPPVPAAATASAAETSADSLPKDEAKPDQSASEPPGPGRGYPK